MTEKILTVIIPMYNAQKWIRQCLRSLLIRQEVRQYLEVLVINDGSTDGCEKTAEEYEQEYTDVFRILHKENGGHGSAVNAGVSQSRGKYIKILDADDWMNTEQLGKFVEELRSLDDPDLVLCGYETYHIRTEKKQQIQVEPANKKAGCSGRYADMGNLTAHWQQYRPVCTFHGITYRTEFYRRHCRKLPEKVFYDDGYYTIVPASHAEKIYLSGRCLYVYRIGSQQQSISAKNRVKRLGDAKKVIFSVCAAMQEQRTPQGQKYWQYRTVSILADYLVTCFLRFPAHDKKAGRLEAKRFMGKLGKKYPQLERAVRNKYRMLKCMGYLQISEKQFQKLLQIRKMRNIYP